MVVNDDDLILRQLTTSGNIVEDIVRSDRDWLVFATTNPFEEGHIWDVIKDGLRERTAVVVSSAALRSHGLNIPEEVAVETAAFDLWQHMHSNSVLKKLMLCKHVLVTDHDGVFHINTGRGDRFDYYSRPFEGGPESNPGRYGKMSGYEKILIASIVKEMLVEAMNPSYNPSNSDLFKGIDKGVCAGLRLWSRHFECGFPSNSKNFPKNYLENVEELHPFDHLFPEKLEDKPHDGEEKGTDDKYDKNSTVAWVQFPYPLVTSIPGYTEETLKTWSRVEWFRDQVEKKRVKFSDCLANVVTRGLKKTIGEQKADFGTIWCPVARMGDLQAVDREEIDGFLDIYNYNTEILRGR